MKAARMNNGISFKYFSKSFFSLIIFMANNIKNTGMSDREENLAAKAKAKMPPEPIASRAVGFLKINKKHKRRKNKYG